MENQDNQEEVAAAAAAAAAANALWVDNEAQPGGLDNRNAETDKAKRDLETQRLNDTLLPYRVPEDMYDLPVANVADARQPVASLIRYLNTIDELQEATKQGIIAHAVGTYAANPRNHTKKVTIKKREDEYDRARLGDFEIDTAAHSASDAIGDFGHGEEAGSFRRFKFRNEHHKAETRRQLILKALLEVLSEPLGEDADAEEIEQRNSLIESLFTEIGNFNPSKDLRAAEKTLEQKVKTSLARSTNIPKTLGHNILPVPVLGFNDFVSADVKANISKILGNKLFGDPNHGKPLKEFLSVLTHAISGTYSASASFDLLLHVLTNAPRKYVKVQYERKVIPFSTCWIQLQISYLQKSSVDEIQAKLKRLMVQRPNNPNEILTKIVNLVSEKNAAYEPKTRETISSFEIRTYILKLIETWWPHYYSGLFKQFETIEAEALAAGQELLPPDVTLNVLICDYIRGAAAISQKQAEANARMASAETVEFHEISTPDAISAQTTQLLSLGSGQNEHENVDSTPQQPEVAAWNARPQQQQRQSGPPQGARARTKFIPPPHLRNKCYLCASSTHVKPNCPVYDPKMPLGRMCSTCGALHTPARCRNDTARVHELEYQPSDQQHQYDQQQQQQQQSYNPQLQYKPQDYYSQQ